MILYPTWQNSSCSPLCWDIPCLIFWGHLPLEVIFISSIFIFCWSTLLKFQILGRSDHRLMRYSTFYIWASLPLDVVFISSILFWFSPLSLSSKFGKEPISGSWNIHFLIFRSSYILGRLHFKHLWFWFGPLNLSLKYESNLISGCWDIQLLIFWGRLPLDSVFHWRSSSFQVFLILVWSSKLQFKIWGRSDQWLLRCSIFDTS